MNNPKIDAKHFEEPQLYDNENSFLQWALSGEKVIDQQKMPLLESIVAKQVKMGNLSKVQEWFMQQMWSQYDLLIAEEKADGIDLMDTKLLVLSEIMRRAQVTVGTGGFGFRTSRSQSIEQNQTITQKGDMFSQQNSPQSPPKQDVMDQLKKLKLS